MKKGFTKKIAFAMVLVLVLALSSVISANAAVGDVTKYSFTGASGSWLAGAGLYSDEVGYGLTTSVGKKAGAVPEKLSAKDDGVLVGVSAETDPELWEGIRTAVMADTNGSDTVFKVKLAAGTYKFTIYAGGISNNNTYNTNKVYLEGVVFDQVTRNSDDKASGSVLLKAEDFAYVRTITLTEEKVVEVKAVNPSTTITEEILADLKATNPACTYEVGGTCGGRSYLNAVVVEEVAPIVSVPATGETNAFAYVAILAVVCAGAAVLVSKKREEAR